VPRAYHSISSVKLGMRCPRAYAYRYVAGLREPEFAWDDPKAPPRARASGLGKAVHGVFEAWMGGSRIVDWRDLPGQVALSGAHHVPHPDRVHEARVESPIGAVPLPVAPDASPHSPRWAYELHGVLWAGFRDLLVSAPAEFIRLGIDAPDGWALYDYKSTADIGKYALAPEALAKDPQACLYVAATCDELGLEELPARWLYLETKRARISYPVDAVIRRDFAKSIMQYYAAKARELDAIADVAAAPMNTGACGEYGGCYYHHTNGGPCNARRSIGGLIQARVKKDTTRMATNLDPTTQAAFAKFKNGAAKTAPPPAEETADEAPTGAEGGAAETPAAMPMSAPVAAKPRAKKAVAGGPSPGVILAELSKALIAAEAACTAADAERVRLLAAIREACG
jgi:hypothetical protein